ncbi:hypothetical protein O6H91_07G032600 [Diphasiastrum complanatum]|nr:hypothetical protein O6H91_07G032600 [Diphasiastrum complanatum]
MGHVAESVCVEEFKMTMVEVSTQASVLEDERKYESQQMDFDGAVVTEPEAPDFGSSDSKELQKVESKLEDCVQLSERIVELPLISRVGKSGGKLDEGVNGSLARSDSSVVLTMSSNRPRPIAKRDWPPGCGPWKGGERNCDRLEVACSKLKQGSLPMQAEKRQKVEKEIATWKHKKINVAVARMDEDVDFGDANDSGVIKEKNVERDLIAEATDVVGIQACKPVAMKTAFKRKPSSNNTKLKDAQVSMLIAKKSTIQGVVNYKLPLHEDLGEQLSKQRGTEDAHYKDATMPKLKIKHEGILQKVKEEKLKGDVHKKNSEIKKESRSVKTHTDVKKGKKSQKLKEATPAQHSPIPLPELEDGGRDITKFIDDPHDVKARELLRQTLKMFDTIRRKLQRDEEGGANPTGGPKRPDLKAGSLMNEKNLSINRVKKVGFVPGVEVGDHFYFRMELCIVGLHRQIQGGIDSISGKENEWGHPVATSITASGGYEDDHIDDGETIIYTGQGGNNYKGDKRQQEDQKLERGNLAMENSYRLGLPVRVIRGCKDKSSPSGTIYTYDGLYLVKQSWLDRGVSGFGVYKFKLERISGQPQLGSVIVKFVGSLKTKSSKREGMIIDDISYGQEKIPVCVVNDVDDTTPVSDTFQYITTVSLPEGFLKPSPSSGCGCKKSCSSADVCECIRKNGEKAPYIGGLLVEAKNVVYECGVQCGCPPTCHNRVTQHGIKHRLEIFKTKQKGWGVRSWDSIPSGSFVCEYIGELLDSQEAERRIGNDEYLFDLDLIKGNKTRGVDVSMFFNETAEDVNEEIEDANLSVDASNYGNVGRFINHSCSPNLFVQCVLFHHDDLSIPHIMLFAMENIPPLTELTYDYGYTVGQVMDLDGNVKVKICHCGEKNCTGRMY